MKHLYITLIAFLVIIWDKGRAQPYLGCQTVGSTSVYVGNIAGIWGGTPLSTFCGPGSTTATQYAVNVIPRSGTHPCNINVLGGGREVYYTIANCALDDYLAIMFASLGVLAYSFINIPVLNETF